MSKSRSPWAKTVLKRIKPALPSFRFLACIFLAAFCSVSYFISFIHYGRNQYIDPTLFIHTSANNTKNYFHVAVPTTEGVYSQWQSRVMYYHYKKAKEKPGSNMGKFTRILHNGKSDSLMDEIPSFVVDPLPQEVHRGYWPLNRPWAYVKWLQSATIEEDYILMGDPDHIIVKPIPNFAYLGDPVAFPFAYMEPAKHGSVIRKYYPKEMGPVSNIDPIGSSPIIIKKSLMEEIVPTWFNVSLRMKSDSVTEKEFGWVLEMYSYTVAAALHGVKHKFLKDFIVQPPYDEEVGRAFIIHYTYGCNYRIKTDIKNGQVREWSFDKRSYMRRPPPRDMPLPPPGVPNIAVMLIKMLNEASANTPNWDVDDESFYRQFSLGK